LGASNTKSKKEGGSATGYGGGLARKETDEGVAAYTETIGVRSIQLEHATFGKNPMPRSKKRVYVSKGKNWKKGWAMGGAALGSQGVWAWPGVEIEERKRGGRSMFVKLRWGGGGHLPYHGGDMS